MNSKVHKVNEPPPQAESLGDRVSGNFLYQKLEAWCQREPKALMWEVTFEQMPVRSFQTSQGKDAEITGGWRIEFNIVRCSSVGSDGLFDGVAVLAGFIKNSFEMTQEGSREVFLLSLHSRNIKGEKTYFSPQELWKEFTAVCIR